MLELKKTWVRSLGQDDPLEEGMATHSSILVWKIPWTEETEGLQSTGLQSLTRLKWLSKHMTFFMRFEHPWILVWGWEGSQNQKEEYTYIYIKLQSMSVYICISNKRRLGCWLYVTALVSSFLRAHAPLWPYVGQPKAGAMCCPYSLSQSVTQTRSCKWMFTNNHDDGLDMCLSTFF